MTSFSRHIVAVRALPGIGDWLCAEPALRLLRAAAPDARIDLVAESRSPVPLERYGDVVDRVLPFPGFPGIPEVPCSPSTLASFLVEAAAEAYDLCLQLHGSGTWINEFCLLLGARRVAMPSAAVSAPVDTGSVALVPFDAEQHEALRLADVVAAGLELPRAVPPPSSFPLTPVDRREARRLLGRLRVQPPYVVLHPGCRRTEARWPAGAFAEVGRALAWLGYPIVVTGTLEEAALAGDVVSAIGRGAVNAAGRSELATTAALLSTAAVTVANDTGVSHLSAAVGTPTVTVFVSTQPMRWRPHTATPCRVIHAGTSSTAALRRGCIDDVMSAALELLGETSRAEQHASELEFEPPVPAP